MSDLAQAFRDTTAGDATSARRSDAEDRALRIVGMAVSLGVFLIFIRAQLIAFPWVHSVAGRMARDLVAAYHDLAYVAALTLLFFGILGAVRTSNPARRVCSTTYAGLAIFSLLFALANVKIVPMLGRPLNYRWLYYSDFLDSQDVRNAIRAELSGSVLVIPAACTVGLLALSWFMYRILRLLAARFGMRGLAVGIIAPMMLYLVLGGIVVAHQKWDRAKMENPVVAFASSLFIHPPPTLLSMKTSVGFDDFEPPPPPAAASPISKRSAGRVRNALVFVLESVPAQYLPLYGSRYPVTPELERRLGESALFTNIYAQGAITSISLVSLILSAYPWISYQSLTREHPDVPFPSLSSELARRGYRTGFFSSADLRYQGTENFLTNHQFQTVADYRRLHCRGPVLRTSIRDPLLDAANDECIMDAFSQWIRGSQSRPFFAVLWTMMTHQPYFVAGAETDFRVGDPAFNRYLNAIHHSDALIGQLRGILRELRLDDSTLVVVLGDHGEAFGQHDQHGHGNIYEMSLHVPLILINPTLFAGERIPVLGGLLDVPPTILDILGAPSPPAWQGRSLFGSDARTRVYFFAPFGDHLFGFRQGTLKIIDDATEDRFEIYDLASDPEETRNLARRMPAEIPIARQRIAAWVQYQDRMMRRLIGEGAR